MAQDKKVQPAFNEAAVLLDGLQYLEKYEKETVVIKMGGEIFENPELLDNVINETLFLRKHGVNAILVHGGGDQIKKAAETAGIQEKKPDGVRQTDQATLVIATEVLAELNNDLVNKINKKSAGRGGAAVGMPAFAGGVVVAEKSDYNRPDDFVGNPVHVNREVLEAMTKNVIIPVIYPIAQNQHGQRYNVNADPIAVEIAKKMKAARVIMCSMAHGVLDENQEPFHDLTPQKVEALIDAKVITNGMVEKTRRLVEAVTSGKVGGAVVLRPEKGAIISEILGKGGGTLIAAAEKESAPSSNNVVSFGQKRA